jgi:hypothetical protein
VNGGRSALRLKLEDMPANSVEDVQRQEALLIEANEKIRPGCGVRQDSLAAAEFGVRVPRTQLERVRHAAVKSRLLRSRKGRPQSFEHKSRPRNGVAS